MTWRCVDAHTHARFISFSFHLNFFFLLHNCFDFYYFVIAATTKLEQELHRWHIKWYYWRIQYNSKINIIFVREILSRLLKPPGRNTEQKNKKHKLKSNPKNRSFYFHKTHFYSFSCQIFQSRFSIAAVVGTKKPFAAKSFFLFFFCWQINSNLRQRHHSFVAKSRFRIIFVSAFYRMANNRMPLHSSYSQT